MDGSANPQKTGKAYLGILFECCQVYSRVYRHKDRDVYAGRCPKCLKSLRIGIDPSKGVDSKFFKAR